MPYAPDYSDYLKFKKLKNQISVDREVDPMKFRLAPTYSFYHPDGMIKTLPVNIFQPGRLYPPTPPVQTVGFTNFWNYAMYKTSYGAATPIITDPATWGTLDNTLLTELMTSSDTTTPCGYGVDGTIIPRKVNAKWNYIALHITGFFTAPSTGSYVFTASSDDGLQFKVNNTLIINKPGFSSSGSGDSSAISLVSGTKYPIEALWTNGTGGSNCCFTQVKINGSSIMPGISFNSLCSPA